MTETTGLTRRRTLQCLGAAGAALTLPLPVPAAPGAMPTRPVPGTGEALPVLGLGNSQAFRNGDYATSETIVRILLEHGGSVIDTRGGSTEVLGRIMERHDWHEKLFLGTNIETGERGYHLRQIRRSQELEGKRPLDLLFITTLKNINQQWPLMREWKEAGHTRYIGVALIGKRNFPALEVLMETGTMDFIQVNYSMLEPESGERILPLARERGIAVINNRPFINGEYFKLVKGKTLPAWAADFDCDSWAQFSLKWNLANPAINCILTETADPAHARDNLSAAYGRLPDEKERKQMAALVRSF